MNKKRREADKPTRKRKEAKKKMPMPVGALEQEKNMSKPRISKFIRFATKKPEEADALLHDGLSQFERQLILECREDGMSDDEIREWMQEI